MYLRRRPDAQAAAFGPQATGDRDMKSIELDTGVEVVLKSLDDIGAHDRLGAVHQDADRDEEGKEDGKQDG